MWQRVFLCGTVSYADAADADTVADATAAADAEDTPKHMYARLGFRVVDETYEYVCTDLAGLTLD